MKTRDWSVYKRIIKIRVVLPYNYPTILNEMFLVTRVRTAHLFDETARADRCVVIHGKLFSIGSFLFLNRIP